MAVDASRVAAADSAKNWPLLLQHYQKVFAQQKKKRVVGYRTVMDCEQKRKKTVWAVPLAALALSSATVDEVE